MAHKPSILLHYDTSLCTQKPLQQNLVNTALLLGFLIGDKVGLLPVLGQLRELGSCLELALELVKGSKSVYSGSKLQEGSASQPTT